MTIHRTAIVDSKAQICEGVSIGAFSIVHENVIIGSDTRIDSHCEIGYPTKLAEGMPLIIGKNSLIRSHSIFYQGSTFGENLVTGHRVTVREKTHAGINLRIGTLVNIQGDCELGDCVRAHSNVNISKLSRIGNFVWLFPYVELTNDRHPPSQQLVGVIVEDYAVVCAMTVVLSGVHIGQGSVVGAHSLVNRDVPADTVVVGSPARKLCMAAEIISKDGYQVPAYPWIRHFHRGFPTEKVKEWLKQFPVLQKAKDSSRSDK